MKKVLPLVVLLLFGVGCTAPKEEEQAKADPSIELPQHKQTVLGLYLTAKQAYQKWKADPQQVKILDCRTPEEYIFVGHAAAARNVPLMFVEHKWNAEKKSPAMRLNPDFVSQVKQHSKTTDTILIMCRSGGRSARAVNALAEAGFKDVYTITDGFEGDTVKDPDSPMKGKRTKNGWRNSGSPWTYDLDPKLMYLPAQ